MVTTKVGMSKSEHSSRPCLPVAYPQTLPSRVHRSRVRRLSTKFCPPRDGRGEISEGYQDIYRCREQHVSSHLICLEYRPSLGLFVSPALFTAGGGLAQHFSILFHPIASEYDLLGKFPQSAHTIKNVDAYHTALEELRASISPELELIESRVVGPVKELQTVMKAIRKVITKREHKVSNSCPSIFSQPP
jgi:hypothetical protein